MKDRASFLILTLSLLAVACSGGGGDGRHSGRDTTPGGDATTDFGTWDSAPDAIATDPGPQPDPGGSPDTASEDGGLQPLDIPTELPTGDKAFGEPCSDGSECTSGLCFATSAAAGCTIPCDSHTPCAEWGLICQWLSGGLRGCVPPPVSTAVACTDSSVCPFPTVCRTDLGQCEMGACTWDGDCPQGQACEPLVRVCKPAVCQGDPECKNPRLVCRDGACVEPECANDAACGAGKFCQAGTCQIANACDAEGKCPIYNLACVGGFCVPNRCVTPCSKAGDVCDAASGKCGAACASAAQCAAGKTCLGGAVCVANSAPYAAARFLLGSQLLPVGDVAIGAAVPLDGSLSFDPDGDALTYRWVVNAVPFGSGASPGQALGSAMTASYTPDVAGLYAFGLWVTDATGAVSFQDQAVVRVW